MQLMIKCVRQLHWSFKYVNIGSCVKKSVKQEISFIMKIEKKVEANTRDKRQGNTSSTMILISKLLLRWMNSASEWRFNRIRKEEHKCKKRKKRKHGSVCMDINKKGVNNVSFAPSLFLSFLTGQQKHIYFNPTIVSS